MPSMGNTLYSSPPRRGSGCLVLNPVLRLFSASCGRTSQSDQFGHVEADFLFDNFSQGNVCHALICGIFYHWVARSAVAGVELAHALRNHVHQHVWVDDFFEGFFNQFSVHEVRSNHQVTFTPWLSKAATEGEVPHGGSSAACGPRLLLLSS